MKQYTDWKWEWWGFGKYKFTFLFSIERWNDGDQWRFYFLFWHFLMFRISRENILEHKEVIESMGDGSEMGKRYAQYEQELDKKYGKPTMTAEERLDSPHHYSNRID